VSDRAAVEALARRRGVDLAASGVAVGRVVGEQGDLRALRLWPALDSRWFVSADGITRLGPSWILVE
jgi:hypothetical protein